MAGSILPSASPHFIYVGVYDLEWGPWAGSSARCWQSGTVGASAAGLDRPLPTEDTVMCGCLCPALFYLLNLI